MDLAKELLGEQEQKHRQECRECGSIWLKSFLESRSRSTGRSAGSVAGAGQRTTGGAGAEAQVGVQGVWQELARELLGEQEQKHRQECRECGRGWLKSYLGNRSRSAGRSAGSVAGAGQRTTGGAGAEAQVGVQGVWQDLARELLGEQEQKHRQECREYGRGWLENYWGSRSRSTWYT